MEPDDSVYSIGALARNLKIHRESSRLDVRFDVASGDPWFSPALGISMARIDFAPYGLNPPHTHPRGTEILVVVKGTLYVGFVTSNQLRNRLFTKVLYPGDVFVFPIGLIHFQFNIGKTNAVAFTGLSSHNPGVITIANSVFGSQPPISTDVPPKAFQVDKNLVKYLQSQFWWDNNWNNFIICHYQIYFSY